MTIFSMMIYSQNTTISYTYDNAGNRISRKTIILDPPPSNAPTLSNNIDSSYVADNFDKIDIKIYPNPTSGRLKIELSGIDNQNVSTIRLHTINGELLKQESFTSSILIVNMEQFPSGLYLLHLNHGEMKREYKIIKK